MADPNKDYAYKSALSFVNKMRKRIGKKPLKNLRKGIQDDCQNCSISNSIFSEHDKGKGSIVSTNPNTISIWYREENGITNGFVEFVPKNAGVFVRKFDKGLYPRLVKNV